jgi:hypothetical protein
MTPLEPVEAFDPLSSGKSISHPGVRGVIADSWRRARLSGLSPSSTVDALKADDYDTSSRLLRAAEPVLNQMAAALDGALLRDVGRPRRPHRRDALGLPAHAKRVRLLGEALHGTVFRELDAVADHGEIPTTELLAHKRTPVEV